MKETLLTPENIYPEGKRLEIERLTEEGCEAGIW
jgi:hypothetical protein